MKKIKCIIFCSYDFSGGEGAAYVKHPTWKYIDSQSLRLQSNYNIPNMSTSTPLLPPHFLEKKSKNIMVIAIHRQNLNKTDEVCL